MAWLTLDNSCDESVRDGRVGRVAVTVEAREETILQVSLDPGARARARVATGAEVDGLHMAIAVVKTVGLSVAVIEAAPVVVVSTIHHSIHALRLVAGSSASDIVVAVTCVRRDEYSVCLLSVQLDGCTDGTGQIVVSTFFRASGSATRRSLCEVITAAGLIIDDAN